MAGEGKSSGGVLSRVVVSGVVVGALLAAGLTPAGAQVSRAAAPLAPSTHLSFTKTPGTVTAGATFDVQVTAENADSATLTTSMSTITLTLAASTGTPVALTCTGGDTEVPTTGVATFECTIGTSGTGDVLTATDATGGISSAESGPLDVSAGTAAKIVFTQQPKSITAGDPFGTAPVLTVEDAKGNPVDVTGIDVDLTAIEASGQGPLSCKGGGETPSTKGAAYQLVASDGSATFEGCTIDEASSTPYELVGVATIGSQTPLQVLSSTFDVSAGPPSKLVFTTNPNAALLDEPFGSQPVVAVEDAVGNVDPVTGTVTLSVATGPTGPSTTEPEGCTGGTITNGVATFATCALDVVGTGYTLEASLTVTGGTITGTSGSFAVSAGAAASLAFVTEPGNGKGGSPLTSQPVVKIEDATGDPVSGTVQLSIETAPAGATLSCAANPTPAGTGVATFSGCAVNKDGTYHLVAADPDATGATEAVSTTLTITTGPAAQVDFTTSPSSSTGGTPFQAQPTVSVEDLGGNPVKGSTVVLGIAQGSGTSGAQLTCAGDPGDEASAATGTVTFTGCAIDAVGSGYELTATSGGAVGKSGSFDVSLGSPAQLDFSAEPSGGTVSTPLGGQPQVTLTDLGGNPEPDAGVTVTLATSSGGALTCLADPVPTNGTGVAVFAGCKAGNTGKLTLTASGDGFTATSAPFTVVGGSPLGVAPVGVPAGQTFGGSTLGTNPTSVADDVDSATGALDVGYTDLKVAAVGEPFTLTRTYNSDDTTGGSFGPGWSSVIDAGVEVAATGKTAVVRGPDGQQLVFTSDGRGGWVAPAGARVSLTCQGTLCTVTEFDGTVFQSIAGKIQDYVSADGIGLHFVYAHGRLVRITGSAESLVGAVDASLGAELGAQAWTSTKAGSADLASVAVLGPTHLWAVGSDCTIELSVDGGTAWAKDTNVSGCAVGTNLTSVTAEDGVGPVFAVGTNGTVLVCAAACDSASARWTAPSSSSPVPPTDVAFSSVWSPETGDVYAVGTTTSGAGEIWACSASCVTSKPGPPAPKGASRAGWVDVAPSGLTSTALTSISGRATGLVVAVGAKGTVLVCSAPTCATSSGGWSKLTAGTGGTVPASTLTLTGVWAGEPGDVYAVGTTTSGAGEIWACSDSCSAATAGSSTSSRPGRPSAPRASVWADVTPRGLDDTSLEAVSGQGSDTWAVGSDGRIWYCPADCATEPTDWVSVGAPGGSDGLAGITSSAGGAWAVGAGGTVDSTTGTGPTFGTLGALDALDDAIADLGAALTATRWVDGNDLSPGQGSQVFAQAQKAIQELWQLAAPPPGPPSPSRHPRTSPAAQPSLSTAPAWDAAALLDLAQALRIVDANALSENVSGPERPSALGSAEADYAAAGSAIASGQYPLGADDYQQAWSEAIAARGSGQGSRTPLEVDVDENADGEVTAISTPTRSVQYAYTGDVLTSFTDADTKTWTYAYTGATSLLTQVVAPTGVTRLTVVYAAGRVSRASALGSQTHFVDTYAWDPSAQTSTRSSLVQLAQGAPKTTAASLDEYAGNVLLAQQLPDGATTSYSYDGDLDLTGIQDPLGQVERMTYDAAGNLLAQSTPAYGGTAAVRFTYDGDHQVESETDANGNTTKYAYTGGNLVEVSPPGPASDATRYRFNELGEEYEAIGPTATETFTYDDAGNQTGYQLLSPQGDPLDGLGPVFSYDEAGQVTVSTDPRGHSASGLDPEYQTVDTYDPDGELLSTTTPGTQTTSTTYTPAGSVASVTSPTGAKTTYSWDEAALQLTSTAAHTKTVSTYDPSGQLLAQGSGPGATTTYTYDPSGHETSKTGPTEVTTSYRYDIEGNVIASSTSAGGSSSFTYDPANQIVSSTESGVTTSATYDLDGNVASKTDADGRVTTYRYNSHELLASVTTAAGTTSYTYDPSGNLVAVTDADEHTTHYQVNGAGERTEATLDGNATSYAYDVAGNLVSTTDPDGRTTTYTVNPQDERTAITYTQAGQEPIDISLTFDAAGQRTSVTETTTGGSTYKTTYSYDASGELASATTGGDTYRYDYSTPGEMVETYPDGTKITYTYDDADSLMGVSTTTGIDVSYVRSSGRQVTGIAYSNGILQSARYDAADLVTSMSLTCGGTTELTRATSFDAAGDPLAEATTVGTATTTESYGYDSSARVDAQLASTTTATHALKDTGCASGTRSSTPAGNDTSGTTSDATVPTTGNQPVVPTEGTPGGGTSTHPIGYDGVGNITSMGTTTIGYNAADEVTSESGSNQAGYTYDKNGDVTSETVGGVTTTYSYNAADELVAVTDGSTRVTYTYDGNGNRMTKTVTAAGTSTTTDYSWDPDTTLPLLTLVCSGDCADRGNVVDQLVYGVGPVAMETHTGVFYLHQDQQGDVVAVSNDKGAVVETYRYGALGAVTATQVGTGTTPYEPLLFQSQYLTTSTGLYDMRARDYDPTSGTFLQRDPVAPAVGTPVFSPYSYADDQAPASADPTGDESASDLVDSWFYGHSTTTTDIVAATQLGLDVPKLAIKAGTLIANYGETTVAEAMNEVQDASSAIADLGPDFAEEASSVTEDLGGLSDAASVADGAGLALSVAGVGLSAYVTVEDCEHGPLAQCVGDAVGTAIGAACAVGGVVAAAVGTAGAAVPAALALCGLLAAALSIVIAKFGPQIVQGLTYLGQYAVEGLTDAYDALQTAFEDAGSALTGAYATVAAEATKGFSEAVAALAGAYSAARGVLTTGFNELDGYISSGVASAVSTLEKAGLTALRMAYVLKDVLGEGLDAVVNQLVELGYDVDGVAAAIEGAFEEGAQEAAVVLQDFEYSYGQIASGLDSAYKEAAVLTAQILEGIGATIGQIATALKSVYDSAVDLVATVLKGLGYTVDEVAGALYDAFTELAAGTVAGALEDVGYAVEDIAGAIATVFEDGAAAVAAVLQGIGITTTAIASALLGYFQTAAATIAKIFRTTLKDLATTVASALENAYGESASAVTGLLKTAGYAITQVEQALTKVFHLTTSAIESALSSFWTNTVIAGLGGAFSSLLTTIKTFFTTVGSTISGWF